MKCFVKENSPFARIAAWKLGVKTVAIVFGRTIHLHNARKEELIRNTRWLRHEIAHIKQYRQHGYFMFVIKYLWESILRGYKNNPFEIMARAAEKDESVCDDVEIN